MLRAREPASRSLSRASTPSAPGISRSSSITSGSRRSASLTTSSPSAASPTTSKSGWVPSTATRPSRSIGWSSATRSLTLSTLDSFERHGDLDARTLAGATLDRQGAAQHLYPLPHADDAVPIIRDAGRVEAVAIVPDDELHRLRCGHEPDRHTACVCVGGDVGESLLADAIKGDLDPRRERAASVHGPESRRRARLCFPAVDEGLQRLWEGAAFERGGTEIEDRASRLIEVGTGEREGAAQRFADTFGAGLIVVEEGFGRLELEPRGGKPLGEGVVDLTRQAVALLDGAEPGASVEEAGPLDCDGEQVAYGG